MVGRCSPASHPASHPTIPTATLLCDGDDVPSPTSLPGPVGAGTRTAAPAGRWDDVEEQGRKGEEHRRAWERVGEAERSLRGREARVMGRADRVVEGRTEGTGRPQGGEAQAVEELQWAWADFGRRQERVERGEGRQTTRGGRGAGGSPLTGGIQAASFSTEAGE